MPRRIAPIATVLIVLVGAADAARGADCADCDGNGSVSINELITGINIVLGAAELSACPALDRDGDGTVMVAELIAAVSQALEGCSLAATPTVTASAGNTPTPTPTVGSGSQLPPTDAPALLAWLRAGSYLDWQAESAPHPGTGPHFGVVRVFVNDALFGSLSAVAPQHPAGAAAVKELYGSSGSSVRGWAVMVKIQDDSDRGSGWYWYETFGNFAGGGIGIPGCTNCHSIGMDFVRIPFPLQ